MPILADMQGTDVQVERDSGLSDSGSECSWRSGSGSESGCKNQTILRTLQKLMSGSWQHATSEDDISEIWRSGTSTPRHSGASTPRPSITSTPRRSASCTASGASNLRTSKLHLRDMPLTRDLLKNMQQNQEDQEVPSTRVPTKEDLDVVSGDGSSSFCSEVSIKWVESGSSANTRDMTDGSQAQREWLPVFIGRDTGSSGACNLCMFPFVRADRGGASTCEFCHFSQSQAAKFPRPRTGKKQLYQSLKVKNTSQDATI